ncbi:hypothetical protein [Bacillus cereus]|uniref:Uncharacterized protein n=1 Tax=Bacillus cereus VD184 TaxID=1053242 RepID=A0A9W5R0E7_BACCE|nr:hypothetical protein [Bacillus cereus]EOQ00978.1 hypothetical protein IKC_06176 [Bacillus cereus VD184]
MKLTIAVLGFLLLITYQVILGYDFNWYSYALGVYVILASSWVIAKEESK